MRSLLSVLVVALTAATIFGATRSLPVAIDRQVSAEQAAELAAQTDALNAQIDDLTAANLDQTSALAAATAQRDLVTADLEQRTAQAAELASQNAALSDQLAALDTQAAAESETRQALQDEIDAGLAEVQTLQAQIASLEAEGLTLTARIEQLESSLADASLPADEQTAQLETQLEQATAALTEAESRVAELSEAAASADPSTAPDTAVTAELETQIAALTAQASELADALEKRDEVITGLMSQMSQAQTAVVSPAASCQSTVDAIVSATQISFEAGTATLTDASLPVLSDIATVAIDCALNDVTLEIEGHTDASDDASGDLLLSDARANAVRDILTARGVPGASMRAVGFGSSEPAVDSDGTAQNERIVFDWE